MLLEFLENRKMSNMFNIKHILLNIRCLDIVVIFILVAIFNNILSALIISSIYVIWELYSNKRVDYVLLDSIGVAVGWLLYEVIITII